MQIGKCKSKISMTKSQYSILPINNSQLGKNTIINPLDTVQNHKFRDFIIKNSIIIFVVTNRVMTNMVVSVDIAVSHCHLFSSDNRITSSEILKMEFAEE